MSAPFPRRPIKPRSRLTDAIFVFDTAVMRRLALLLWLALPALADNEALIERLRPQFGPRLQCAAAYSSYADGRPRLVIAGVVDDVEDRPDEESDVLLLRLPDRAKGTAAVVDTYRLDTRPCGIWFTKLIDARDIVVVRYTRHPPHDLVLRITGGKLVEILDDFTCSEGLACPTPDLNGDGVPEVISSGYIGGSACGGAERYFQVSWWNGRRFVADDRRLIAGVSVSAGEKDAVDSQVSVRDPPLDATNVRCIVRLYRNRGVRRVRISIDGKGVKPGHWLRILDGCHTMTLRAWGTKGAVAYAFLERERQ